MFKQNQWKRVVNCDVGKALKLTPYLNIGRKGLREKRDELETKWGSKIKKETRNAMAAR